MQNNHKTYFDRLLLFISLGHLGQLQPSFPYLCHQHYSAQQELKPARDFFQTQSLSHLDGREVSTKLWMQSMCPVHSEKAWLTLAPSGLPKHTQFSDESTVWPSKAHIFTSEMSTGGHTPAGCCGSQSQWLKEATVSGLPLGRAQNPNLKHVGPQDQGPGFLPLPVLAAPGSQQCDSLHSLKTPIPPRT